MKACLLGYLVPARCQTYTLDTNSHCWSHSTPFLSAQNIQLYAFGVLFNGLGLAVSGALGGGGLTGLTRGYSPVTYLVVANLGFTGLLVSWVMKFADSIMKVRGEKRREEMCDQ